MERINFKKEYLILFIPFITMNRRNALVYLFAMLVSIIQAQPTLLPLELQFRGGVSLFPDGSGHYFAPTIAVDLLTNPGRNIGFGLTMNAGNGQSNFINSTTTISQPSRHFYTGMSLRFSRSRIEKFRPFIQFRYGILQMSTRDSGGKDDKFTTTKFGFSTGLMIRLGTRIHLILPEVGLNLRSAGFAFETPNNYLAGTPFIPMVNVSTGLAWQIGHKR